MDIKIKFYFSLNYSFGIRGGVRNLISGDQEKKLNFCMQKILKKLIYYYISRMFFDK